MARVFFALILGFAILTQATVLQRVDLEVRPDLVVVLLLVWSAQRGFGEGLAFVFGAGLLLDVLAMDRFGTNGLALLPVVLLGGPARRRFFHSGLVFPIVLAIAATLAHGLMVPLVRSFAGGESGGVAVQPVILQALLNALLVPPLYLVASWTDRGPAYEAAGSRR